MESRDEWVAAVEGAPSVAWPRVTWRHGHGAGHWSRVAGRGPASRRPRWAGLVACRRCSRRVERPGCSLTAAASSVGEAGPSGGSAESALLDLAWRNGFALGLRFFLSLPLSLGGGSWVVLEDWGVRPALLLSRADEVVEAVEVRGGSTGEGADEASLLDRAWVRGDGPCVRDGVL